MFTHSAWLIVACTCALFCKHACVSALVARSLGGSSTPGQADVNDVPLLHQDALQACHFEVVMFDTRNLTDIPSFDGELFPDQYWSLSAVLNYAYAKHFGYDFSFIHLNTSNMQPGYNVAWHRVFYFAKRLQSKQRARTRHSCNWLVYLDTDAFFSDFATSLPGFIGSMAAQYDIRRNVGAIFAQEQAHLPEMAKTWHAINAGVYLVQENEASQHLFDTWVSAAGDDAELRLKWPAEQGVLSELYFLGKYYTKVGRRHAQLRAHDSITKDIALVNMTEMNSPWGRFIKHLWSGPGYAKRDTDFMSMLKSINSAEPHHFQSLLTEVRKRTTAWAPKANVHV